MNKSEGTHEGSEGGDDESQPYSLQECIGDYRSSHSLHVNAKETHEKENGNH